MHAAYADVYKALMGTWLNSTHKGPSLVFSDDWGRHPSSCQHLVRQLLPRYDVHWVNTIGMRRPRLDRVTLARTVEKCRSWLRRGDSKAAEAGANPRIYSPRMWPWFSGTSDRLLNRMLLTWQLDAVVKTATQPVTAITTVPIVAELLGRLSVARWVYYCVDDFSKWPEMDGSALTSLEELLVQRADTLVAASEALQGRLQQFGRESRVLTHGVELGHWRRLSTQPSSDPFAGLERPIVLFWGLINWHIDVEFLRRLSADLSEGTIVLVGPQANPDPALKCIARVRVLPPVEYRLLPALAAQAFGADHALSRWARIG